MTGGRAAALVLLAAAPVFAAGVWNPGSRAHAREWGTAARTAVRGTVEVIGPSGTGDITEATPEFTVVGQGFTVGEQPVMLRLMISTRADLSPPLFLDTIVTADAVSIRPPRALPERQQLWWRATATTALGEQVTSALYGPRTVAPWVQLVFPNAPNGAILDTRRPRFTWTSLPVTEPPGPWSYDLNVISVGAQRTVIALRSWPDTTFVPTSDLESNTSYRWEVIARLETGESAVATSASSFVVTDESSPLTTLLYQNFPNPFPTPTSSATCIWFDLHQVGPVRLEIYDLRGHLVRLLLDGSAPLLEGRYGRGGSGDPSACDPEFSWDGTADDGRTVPPGVYLVRLRAAGVESVRRMLFRGR